MKTTVVYHFPCLDGYASKLAAAYLLNKQEVRNVTYIKGEYYKDINPDDFDGADVYLVDFSYKRDVVTQICNLARKVTILDHHESAFRDLDNLDVEIPNLTMYFDVAKEFEMSGVGITWWYFTREMSGISKLPKVFKHVQDRDLWNFKLDGTKEVCAALDSFNWNNTKWMEACFHNNNDLTALLAVGESLGNYADMLRDHIEKTVVYEDLFGFEKVPVLVNCPKPLFSEIARRFFTAEVPITVSRTWDAPTNLWVWSIRSADDSPIVLELVKPFGGGGHVNAGGFSTVTENPFADLYSAKDEPPPKEERSITFQESLKLTGDATVKTETPVSDSPSLGELVTSAKQIGEPGFIDTEKKGEILIDDDEMPYEVVGDEDDLDVLPLSELPDDHVYQPGEPRPANPEWDDPSFGNGGPG